MTRVKLLLILFVLTTLSLPVATVLAQTSTPTPTNTLTPTATNTLTNQERAQLSTIAPIRVCGNIFTPCGALPWSIPIFPTAAMASPTIRPTVPSSTPVPVTQTPTSTLTPTTSGPTNTPNPYVTATAAGLDISGVATLVHDVNSNISTMAASGSQPILVNGTPQGVVALADQLGSNIGGLFGYAKGWQAVTNNRIFGPISAIVAVFVFVFVVKLLTMFLPAIGKFIQFILQVIQTFKPV